MLGAASFRKCMTMPPMMSLEDARVASCVYRFGGEWSIDLAHILCIFFLHSIHPYSLFF